MKRTELKLLRIKNNLTQERLAEELGVSVATYNLIENGKRVGSNRFWLAIKTRFNLSGGDVWKLQNPEK